MNKLLNPIQLYWHDIPKTFTYCQSNSSYIDIVTKPICTLHVCSETLTLTITITSKSSRRCSSIILIVIVVDAATVVVLIVTVVLGQDTQALHILHPHFGFTI